jgi:hypothetical protein
LEGVALLGKQVRYRDSEGGIASSAFAYGATVQPSGSARRAVSVVKRRLLNSSLQALSDSWIGSWIRTHFGPKLEPIVQQAVAQLRFVDST